MDTVKNLEIREMMLKYRITQVKLGKLMGLSQPHVSTLLSYELTDEEKEKIIKLIEKEVKRWKK